MYKPDAFKKACPVCQAISKSKTKRYCNYCKAELIDLEGNKWYTDYSSFDNTITWKFFKKTKKFV